MPETTSNPAGGRRVALMLILAASAVLLLRILTVHSSEFDTPFLSANDISRWATIRALVEDGDYAVDTIVDEPEYRTIDLVRHEDRAGDERTYSSKPTLYPTLVAPTYGVLHALGVQIEQRPFLVGRATLILSMLVPMVLYLVAFGLLVERITDDRFTRTVLLVAAGFATYVTTFAISLNNHVPAAMCALAALYFAWPILADGRREPWRFALCGLFAAGCASFELPALSFLGLIGLALLMRAPRPTMVAFVPAVLLVAVAYLGTNRIAHDSWRPPYLHNGPGKELVRVDWPENRDPGRVVPPSIRRGLAETGRPIARSAKLLPKTEGQRWELADRQNDRRYLMARHGGELVVYEWDNWYDYEGSFWTRVQKDGITAGERSASRYAFHALMGHHGVFSLTPFFALGVLGMVFLLRQGPSPLRELALATLVISGAVLLFYLTRPASVRNYGGTTACFRWLIWLTPLWLLMAIPALERLAPTTRGRAIAVVLLIVSIASAASAWANPWTRPWIFRLFVDG